VNNHLDEDTSIHWHGFILPTEMDGVPGLSFAGIKPGESFTYHFTLQQAGTYWYHSHSGYQEQLGVYGGIVIEDIRAEAGEGDGEHSGAAVTDSAMDEHVLILSDFADTHPHNILTNLKAQPHYYNQNERTLADFFSESAQQGFWQTFKNRHMWNQMRMADSDISDVTAKTYRYLLNGFTHDAPQQLLFNQPKVKLRFINAAAMTIFDVQIPGLKMTVIEADGQEVEPVSVDEFRIGVAETYDVLVEPTSNSAYSIFAQSIDRGSYALAFLTADKNLKAVIPALDNPPLLTHADMGMAHDMQAMNSMGDMQGMGHHHHHGHKPESSAATMGSGKAGFGSAKAIDHSASEFGPHVEMRAEDPQYRLDDPGVGLRERKAQGKKVLTYADLKNRYPTQDVREPSREIELHLTGNMSRYMWSINGVAYKDAEPIILQHGERVRFTLVNDTMMNHPMHLHGLWSELETGHAGFLPRKHTVIVQPGSKISYLVTADSRGRWAYHCHLLFHMASMFREVRVV
jgi:CopA family copper-resistance protein